jgi:hypothetical protein
MSIIILRNYRFNHFSDIINSMNILTISSPLGDLIAIASETHLVMLEFADSKAIESKIEKFGFVIPSEAEGSLSKSSYKKKGSISP